MDASKLQNSYWLDEVYLPYDTSGEGEEFTGDSAEHLAPEDIDLLKGERFGKKG